MIRAVPGQVQRAAQALRFLEGFPEEGMGKVRPQVETNLIRRRMKAGGPPTITVKVGGLTNRHTAQSMASDEHSICCFFVALSLSLFFPAPLPSH